MTTDNIYSAPSANLTSSEDLYANAASPMKFYVVARYKFILLFICTLGFYKLYWFYKNWSRYKAWTQDTSIWPVPRGIFTIFFAHSLFRNVEEGIAQNPDTAYTWNAQAYATAFVIAQLIVNVLDRYNRAADNKAALAVQFGLMLPAIGTILYSAQGAINAACGDPEGESNSKFSIVNWIWLILGGACLTLIALGFVYGDA